MGLRNIVTVAFFSFGITSPLIAEEHMVVVTGFSYFPEIVYVQPGDTVLFINKSGTDQTVFARDGSWVVGPLPNNGEASLTITGQTELNYFGLTRRDAAADDTAPIGAEMSFLPAPLG